MFVDLFFICTMVLWFGLDEESSDGPNVKGWPKGGAIRR
jgi:hypothetical protein